MFMRKIVIVVVAAALLAAFIFFITGKYINNRFNEIQVENRSKFDSINHEITLNKQFYDSTGKLNEMGGEHIRKILQQTLIANDTSLESENKAALYLKLEMFDKAIPELRIAVAIDSEFVYALAYAFEKNKQIDSAKFYYRKFLQNNPNAKDVKLRLDSLTSLSQKSK